MKLRVLVLAVVLPVLAGCGRTSTNAVITGKPSYGRVSDVRIIMDGAPVPEGLQEIAIVQATGSGTHANLAHVIEGLKEEAKKHGCDTVIRVKVDQGATIASANGVCVRTAVATPQ